MRVADGAAVARRVETQQRVAEQGDGATEQQHRRDRRGQSPHDGRAAHQSHHGADDHALAAPRDARQAAASPA